MIPFYKELLYDNSLTPNERIVYSYLIYKSISHIGCAFNQDGIDMDVITDTLETERYITMYKISYRKLADELCMSPRSVIDILHDFKFYGIIDGDDIHIPSAIVNGGYFPLCLRKELNGKLLIFYSYIKNKSEKFGGQIDTFKWKLAEELKTTKIAITNMLNRLYKLKLAKRLSNGNLIVY